MQYIRPSRRGFGLIEMLVGAAILSTVLLAASSFFQKTLRASKNTEFVARANFLLEEGVEVTKFLRDKGYTQHILSLSTTTPSRIAWTTGGWATTSSVTLIDGIFDRTISASDVLRDGTDDISSSGTYTPDTKLITVNVSWREDGATTTKSISTYITNIFGY